MLNKINVLLGFLVTNRKLSKKFSVFICNFWPGGVIFSRRVSSEPRGHHYYLCPLEKYIYNNITADRARPRKMIFPFSQDCRCIIFHDRYLLWDFYYECVRCLYPFFIAPEIFDGILILWQIRDTSIYWMSYVIRHRFRYVIGKAIKEFCFVIILLWFYWAHIDKGELMCELCHGFLCFVIKFLFLNGWHS